MQKFKYWSIVNKIMTEPLTLHQMLSRTVNNCANIFAMGANPALAIPPENACFYFGGYDVPVPQEVIGNIYQNAELLTK